MTLQSSTNNRIYWFDDKYCIAYRFDLGSIICYQVINNHCSVPAAFSTSSSWIDEIVVLQLFNQTVQNQVDSVNNYYYKTRLSIDYGESNAAAVANPIYISKQCGSCSEIFAALSLNKTFRDTTYKAFGYEFNQPKWVIGSSTHFLSEVIRAIGWCRISPFSLGFACANPTSN